MSKSKKLSEIYIFTEQYEGLGMYKNDINIILEINYSNKTYQIKPINTQSVCFKFGGNSNLMSMHLAVVRAMQEAIDFAKEELKE